MTTGKRLFLFIVNFVFRFSLFSGLSLLAAVLVVANKNTIKGILINVNAHERFTQSVVDSTKNANFDNPNTIPLDRPEIISAIQKSLDKKSLQKITDNFIDSGYDWLDGKTPDIEFSVDVTKNKQVLADSIADYAITRIARLSPCTAPPKQTNVFTVECNPTGVDLGVLRIEIVKMIMDDKSLFPTNKITLDQLPKTSEGQTITQAYSKTPKYFHLFKIAPFILIGLVMICATIIVFSARTRRSAIKTIGRSLIGTAVILAITPLIYIYVLPMFGFSPPNFNGSDQTVSAIVNDATSELYASFNTMLINVAFQVGAIGLVILLVARFMKQSSSIYSDLEKKSGLTPSEPKKMPINPDELPEIPVQSSENPIKKGKKVSTLEKKYRKM